MNLLDYSILNVDDYRPSLYARSKVLRQAGFEVLEATNGAAALQMLSDLRPPLVLLDVNLPDMSGFEVCKKIRSTPTIAGTTVVHISASSNQSRHQVYGLDSGADSYMVEPVEPEVLIATVKAFLRARQAEDALRRSNEDLGRFSYTVAHELSEPLRTITVHAQLLERKLGGQLTGETADSFQFVMQSAHRMRSFIDDLLRYSHATHPSGTNIAEIDTDVLLTQVLFNLDAVIQSKAARITHDPMPKFVGDARIEQVLQNLITNAIKYSRSGVTPEVHVSAREDQGSWTFSVRDNGIGIDPQYKDGIFQIFRRLHGRDVAGHGIGWRWRRRSSRVRAEKFGWNRSRALDRPSISPFRRSPNASIVAVRRLRESAGSLHLMLADTEQVPIRIFEPRDPGATRRGPDA
jgi:signal transduction histidine kinase